jgi:hypothetical protein
MDHVWRWRRQRVHVHPATLSPWHMPVTGATVESCRGVLLIECSLYPRIAIKGGVEILRRFSPLYTQQSTSVILAESTPVVLPVTTGLLLIVWLYLTAGPWYSFSDSRVDTPVVRCPSAHSSLRSVLFSSNCLFVHALTTGSMAVVISVAIVDGLG